MGEEHCIEDLNQEGYISLGKIIQGTVFDTFRAWRLVDLVITDGFLDLVRFDKLVFAGSGQEVRPQRHANNLQLSGLEEQSLAETESPDC